MDQGVFTSTYLPIYEVFEYTLEYASVLYVQKRYQVHLASSTERHYLGLQRLCLVDMYFHTRQSQHPVFFYLHVIQQANKDICTNHLQAVRFSLDMFQTFLAQQYPV